MQSTVSRRFVFIKLKRKRNRPKPPLVIRNDDQLIGEAARSSAPLFAARPAPAPETLRAKWIRVAAWCGGLAALVGVVAVIVGFAAQTKAPAEQVAAPRNALSYPGYARSGGRGSPAAGGGGGGASSSASGADRFLASPFPKRKPTTCAVQMDGSKEAIRDFSKCLEQANDGETPPTAR